MRAYSVSIEHVFDVEVLRVVGQLAKLDASACTSNGVEFFVGEIAKTRAWLDSVETGLVLRADELLADGQGAGATGTLVGKGNASNKAAKQKRRRANTVKKAPEVGDKLASGDISSEHVDALSQTAKSLSEEQQAELFGQSNDLADRATSMSVEAYCKYLAGLAKKLQGDEGETKLEKQKKATNLRSWKDKNTGMLRVAGDFDPELGECFLAGLEQQVNTLVKAGSARNDHTTAHALVQLVSRGRAAAPHAPIHEMVLIVDDQTLEHGLHDHSRCHTSRGSDLPPETVRRLTCSTQLTVVIRGADGQILNAARTQRAANRAQRRALMAMYGCCAWKDCDTSFEQCHMHHIDPWNNGGLTDLDNLIPLCSEHHHRVHEGKWKLELDEQRRLTITQPDRHIWAILTLPSAPAAKAARRTPPDKRQPAMTGAGARGRPPT